MKEKRSRLLSDAEIEIWLKVARSVTPRPDAVLPATKPKLIVSPVAQPMPVPPPSSLTLDGPKRPPGAPMPAYSPPQQGKKPGPPPLVGFEKRFRQKVAHGRVEIEGVIDLHGMNQATAHDALHGFLRAAQRGGSRLVLVVTGKGRARVSLDAVPHEREPGVLRRAVPNWLREPEMRSIVLGFEEASLPHGGMGALYIRIRRTER